MSLLWPILRHGLFSPKSTAVVDDNTTYSYGRLAAGSMFMARHIRRLTDAPHVGILLPTSGAAPLTIFGCWLDRRAAVPFNYLLSKNELNYVINDSDVDTVFTAGKMLGFLGGEEAVNDPTRAGIPENINVVKMEELAFRGLPPLRIPPRLADDDLAVILYTSGTSGKPKGVMLTHGNLESDVRAAIEHANLTYADTFLGVLPQFHSFGLTALTLIPLAIGTKVVYTARFMPKKIATLIKQHHPDIFMAVPSMYGALLSVKNATADDYKCIRLPISGGEPLPDAVYKACLDKLGLKLLEGYGLTETSPGTHWSTPERNKRYSVGQALPGVLVYILGDHDQVLKPNEEGEIAMAGPIIMKGYYKLDDVTQSVMIDIDADPTDPRADKPKSKPVRAFRTGDIGKVDDEGYLFITGRKKEMLIIGGENVFPREIEEVLNQHPSIKASAVIGKSDDVRGEVAIAFVELAEDADKSTFDANDVRNFARQTLAQFKVPREIHVMDALPRNPTGKILRRELKANDE